MLLGKVRLQQLYPAGIYLNRLRHHLAPERVRLEEMGDDSKVFLQERYENPVNQLLLILPPQQGFHPLAALVHTLKNFLGLPQQIEIVQLGLASPLLALELLLQAPEDEIDAATF